MKHDSHFTIGEIFRKGLLKNHLGKPYKNRGSVSRVVQGLKYLNIVTPHGMAKSVPLSEIKRHNEKWS